MNWPVIKLRDLQQKKRGSLDPSKNSNEIFTLYSIPAYDIGEPQVLKGSEIGSSKQFVSNGDILISKIVPHIRRAWVVDDNYGNRQIASGEWIVFNSEQILPQFFRQFLLSDVFHRKFMTTVAGVGGSLLRAQPRLVADFNFSLPPLAEQQRIAALLDTADRILKQRESAITKLDQLAQSVFLNELRASDSSSYRLADVAEMYQPKTISVNELIENGEYVVYGANGVIGRYDKFNHADSEVLVTCRGATCGTVNWSKPLSWITGNAMVVKPLNNSVTKDFLHYYFKFIADFSSVITGAAQPQITRQNLSRLPIVIPKLENQNEITNVVRKIYKKHDLMNFSKNKLYELTRALQNQSFSVN
jgi:type I restriction enzyme S subunit